MSDKERRGLPRGFVWPCVDGKPVVPGDVLWDSDGTRRRVTEVRFWREGCYVVMDDRSEWGGLVMDREYTRTEPPKPVLGKDGKAIEPGDVVWGEDGLNWLVTGFRWDKGDHVVEATARGEVKQLNPGWLTHEEPDSWERLVEDARKEFLDYWSCHDVACIDCPSLVDGKTPCLRYDTGDCESAVAADVVARAKALAGVTDDE